MWYILDITSPLWQYRQLISREKLFLTKMKNVKKMHGVRACTPAYELVRQYIFNQFEVLWLLVQTRFCWEWIWNLAQTPNVSVNSRDNIQVGLNVVCLFHVIHKSIFVSNLCCHNGTTEFAYKCALVFPASFAFHHRRQHTLGNWTRICKILYPGPNLQEKLKYLTYV